jgi:hypothetical protein
MARFRLEENTTARQLGKAAFAAAKAFAKGANTTGKEKKVRHLIAKKPVNLEIRFHYDEPEGRPRTLHIVVPDLSDKVAKQDTVIKAGDFDLKRLAYEAIGTMTLGGYYK